MLQILIYTVSFVAAFSVFLIARKIIAYQDIIRERFVENANIDGIERFAKNRTYKYYLKLYLWLKSHGMEYLIKILATPAMFLLGCVVFGIGAFLAVDYLLPGAGVIGLVAGLVILPLMVISYDSQTNHKMIKDLKAVFDIFATELRGGIHITDAIHSVLGIVGNKRFKKALGELYNQLVQGGDVSLATADFNEGFNNPYITSLAGLIVQITKESGLSEEMLEDISRQLASLQEIEMLNGKKKLENKMQIGMIILFFLTIIATVALIIGILGDSLGTMF